MTNYYIPKAGLKELKEIPEGATKVYLYDNELTELPEIPSSVKILDVKNNKLTTLGELPEGLEELYCSGNKIPLEEFENLPNSLLILEGEGEFDFGGYDPKDILEDILGENWPILDIYSTYETSEGYFFKFKAYSDKYQFKS